MRLFFFFKIFSIHLRGGHGGLRYCGIELFFKGISKILILMCGIAVSSSPGVCGFSHFWLTVFSKRRSFMVLRYRSFALSCLMWINFRKTLDLTVNEYTISNSYSMMKLVGHLMTWLFHRCTDQFEIFSRFLAKVELDFWCIRA